MSMRGVLKALLGIFCAVTLSAGDVLDELSAAVDDLEGCFWRGYFHAPGHFRRDQSVAAADRVNHLARAVQKQRRNRHAVAGNPTGAAMTLVSLLRGSGYAGDNVTVPAQKRTQWSAFLKEFRDKNRHTKGEAPAKFTRDDYEAWLKKITDGNAAKFSQGIKSGQHFSQMQRTRLLGIEQRYRDAIISLRLTIFDLRHGDPAFIRQEKTPKRSYDR